MSSLEAPAPHPLLQAALAYARRGWHVVPLHTITDGGACTCGNPACPSPGKHPRTIRGLHSASTDLDDITGWWDDECPDANIGIVAGPSGLAIVDLDSPEAITTWKSMKLGPPTLVAETSRGMHVYYSDPTQAGKPSAGDGIDLRAANSYVVAPPSRHASGSTYTWKNPDQPIAPITLDILGWFTKRKTVGDKAPDGEPIPDGQRNHTLHSLAGSARRRGHTYEEILALITTTNIARCNPPVGKFELEQIAKSAARYAPGSPEINDLVFWGQQPQTTEEQREEADQLIENWMEFRDHTADEITWIVDGLIAEGSLSFIAAPPKAGKTWLALSLAVSTALGQPYINRPVTAAPVVYVALEGHRSAVRARTAIFARGAGADPSSDDLANLHFIYKPRSINISDPTWAGKITHACETTGARLLIVDVLRKAAPALREDGKGAEDFNQIVELLAPLQATGCAVVLLHHFVKLHESTKGRTIGERMSGSGALFGHADLVLGITASSDGAKHMKIEAEGRDVASFDPIGVRLLGDATGEYGGYSYHDAIRLEIVDEHPEAPDVKAPATDIAKWIKKQPNKQASPREIRDEFGISDGTLRSRRPALEQLGILYQEGGMHSVYYTENQNK